MQTEKQARPMPDHDQWPAFVISCTDGSTGPTDLSYLLEKPAGVKGFIAIRDGHLVDGAGQRWRIWGTNFSTRMNLPPLHLAPQLARHLAKWGINCLRMHFMDLRWPNGILMRSKNFHPRSIGEVPRRDHDQDTRSLDPEAMARLDYLIACCKENGVYVDINLNVARPFTEADGVVQADWLGYAKTLTYFDPRLIELQKEYARDLLTHRNPFTGNCYVDEPAVALVELVNENSILESWLSDRLRGENTQPTGTWSDIPPIYAAELDRRWNAWLAQRYPDQSALSTAWQGDLRAEESLAKGTIRRLRKADFPAASRGRFAAEAEFYAEIEKTYFEDMAAYLREELGVKQIILGSSDHNSNLNNVLHLENLARLGITDGHFYWEHPEFPKDNWGSPNWTILNTPMVDAPDRCVIARVSRSKVKDIPYLVSETNCPFPNDFAAGFLPILAAYGRFQDWDGLFPYDWNRIDDKDVLAEGRIHSYFATGADPVKMAESVAAGLAFLRGDVQSARQVIERRVTREQMIEAQRQPLGDCPYWVPDLPGRLALMHGVQIAEMNAPANQPAKDEITLPEQEIASDTGELRWTAVLEDSRVIFDTPRWQALLGRRGKMQTANLSLQLATPYACVQAVSLEEKPLAETGQILLVTGARVANTGMKWRDSSRQSLGHDFGGAPTRIEPVEGTLLLKGLQGAKTVTVQALDGNGQPVGSVTVVEKQGENWKIELGRLEPSVWHWVKVER
ncbi:MAG: hypothetical protein EHM21_01480 [Chloroflexi bacterium]|nr:MAG: hypothetical protein EHM21_01480 [Chloroflexota bacterium]